MSAALASARDLLARLVRRRPRPHRRPPAARRGVALRPGEFPRPAEVEFRESLTMRRAARWHAERVLRQIRAAPYPIVGERRQR